VNDEAGDCENERLRWVDRKVGGSEVRRQCVDECGRRLEVWKFMLG
jgi:hypothetical protein